MKTKEEQIDYLTELHERCIDSHKGYDQAADSAKSDSMKLYFHNLAMERNDFAHDLGNMIKGLGGTPSETGTFKGTLHRNWLNLKSLLSAETEESIIEECMNGDKALIEDYIDVVKKADLSSVYNNTLGRQLGNVQARVNRLEVLEDEVS